ncbi:MAG: GNAT family N-acetyltransferase [Alphaproteobacteria bacterium]
MITYKQTKDLSIVDLDNLTDAVGWGKRGELWKEIIAKSSYIITAWDNDKIVGMGRIVEDGCMCMVYDIAVLPIHQNQKIGSKIMSSIILEIKEGSYQSVGLFAWNKNPINISFYQKFGFKQVDFGMKLNF